MEHKIVISLICCTAPIVSPVLPFILFKVRILNSQTIEKLNSNRIIALKPINNRVIITPIRDATMTDMSSGRPALKDNPLSFAFGVAHI